MTNSRAFGGSNDEKGWLRCEVAFALDGHKITASHSHDYHSQPGIASMGWVWGLGVGEVLLSLRRYMTAEQWQDFLRGMDNQFDEHEKSLRL